MPFFGHALSICRMLSDVNFACALFPHAGCDIMSISYGRLPSVSEPPHHSNDHSVLDATGLW